MTYQLRIKLLTVILFALCEFGCGTKKDNEAILIIGKYRLTKTELGSKINNDRYRSLTGQSLESKLIEEGRMVAFALDHRYDTVARLKNLFEYAARSYAAQVNGFIWNKTIKPKLQLTEDDIKKAYAKRAREHTLEMVLVRDKSILERYYRSSADLDVVKAKASSGQDVKVFSATVKFPYYPLGYYVDGLDTLKNGQVIGPVQTADGYLIARVTSTDPVVQKPYDQEKAGIRQSLLFGLTQKYLWYNQQRIFKQADPEICDTAVTELASRFDTRQKDWPGLLPDLLIMNYNFAGERVPYRVSDLREFVNNEPVIFGSLTTASGVKKILRYIIVERYMFADAQQMDMAADEGYRRFSKENNEKIFIEHYKRNYVYPRLTVHPQECEEYYRKNSGSFQTFVSAGISLYKFKNIQSAYQGRMQLEKKRRGISPLAGNGDHADTVPLPYPVEMEVRTNDQNNDPKLLGAILRSAPGQILPPVQINGDFVVVVVKDRQGSATMPYSYVKDNIQRIIYAEKEKQLTEQLTKHLEKKYPVEKNEIKGYLQAMKGSSL